MSDKSDERKALEAEAEKLEIKFPANIGDAKLQAKIAEAKDGGVSEQTSPRVASTASSQQAGDGSTPAENSQPSAGIAGASTENGSATPTAGGDKSPATFDELGQAIEVTGPKQGRRRIGRRFTREPTIIPISELSEDEFNALDDDPELSIRPHQPDEEG